MKYIPNTDAADITGVTAGALLDGGGTSGAVTLDVDLSELTDGTADVVGSADELVYLDAGSQKRKQINEIKLGQFNNDQSWVNAADAVAAVATADDYLKNDASDTTTGTITADGFTTTGTWTFDEATSGTVGITTVQDSGTGFADNDTSFMTAAAIADKIEAYGYSTTTGDITGVTAGTNLTGGGASGAVTINLANASTSALGAASFASADFSVSSGAVSLADTAVKTIGSDSGSATPATHEFIIVGGEGIDTSGSDENITISGEDANATNKGIVELATPAECTTGTDTGRAVTPEGLATAKVIGQYAVLRSSAFYLNDNPMVQNSLYFGSAIGNTPWNWNDPQAAGGTISSTASFTIAEDDMNWGIILPFNVSKIAVQCSFRTGLGSGDNFVMAIYTGIRSNSSNTALTLTLRASNTEAFTASQYVTNDVDYTADLNKGTLIYVGIGTEESSNAKQGRGLMNITVVRR